MGSLRFESLATITALAAALATSSGCLAPRASEGEAEEIGHVIPAHKPQDFPTAVRRLRELHQQSATAQDRGRAAELHRASLPIQRDIAKWLPELAGDSDMPEGPWRAVDAESGRLVLHYEAMQEALTRGLPRDDETAPGRIERSLVALERIVAESDPSWFRQPGGDADPAVHPTASEAEPTAPRPTPD